MAYVIYGAVIWFFLLTSAIAGELKIIVHTNTGGHMIHARLYAKHAEKHTSDKIVIKAMPGAAGVTAANYLYNAAPKDGSEIGTIDSRVFVQGITKPEGIQYDLSKFGWIGSAVDNRHEPFIFWAKAGNSSLIAGSESSLPINHIRLINSILKWDIKEVSGYSNSSQVKLAFERDEITLVAYNLTGIRTTNLDWIGNQSILPMVQYGAGFKRHKNFPFVPTVMELAETNQDRKLLEVFEQTIVLGRAFAAPPNTDKLQLAKLRNIFLNVVNDHEYLKDAKKIGIMVNPIDWQKSKNLVQNMTSVSEPILNEFRKF